MSHTVGVNPYLCTTLLPPALFVKGFVANESRCNYESYLLEAMNSSSCFLSLSGGEMYVHPSSESDGEYDAVTEKYSIDFKLVEGNSLMEAKNLLAPGITKDSNGVICWHVSKKSYNTLAVYLNRALRRLGSDDISMIIKSDPKPIKINKRTEDNIDQQIEYELKMLVENLLTKKNLLLFLPETFSFVEGVSYGDDDAIRIIGQALEFDYRVVFDYRLRERSEYDTYMCCLYADYFLIYRNMDSKLEFVDKVSCSLCDTYNYLKREYGSPFV